MLLGKVIAFYSKDSVFGVIHYLREAVVDFVFEIFIKSANYAYDKRKNSISIFKVNIQDIGERNARGILICLYMYRRLTFFLEILD